jgi:hypothetical protein
MQPLSSRYQLPHVLLAFLLKPPTSSVSCKVELMEQDKKAKVRCLHAFRTSGSFLKKQMEPFHIPALRHGFVLDSLTSRIDCLCFHLPLSIFFSGFQVFPDGIYPAGGKSEIESIFPPPYSKI